jgi:hypothetical protein
MTRRRITADMTAEKTWSTSDGVMQPEPGRRANSVRNAPLALMLSSTPSLAWNQGTRPEEAAVKKMG